MILCDLFTITAPKKKEVNLYLLLTNFSSGIMIAKIFGGKSNTFLECENTWLINIHTTKKGIFYYYIKKVFEYKHE